MIYKERARRAGCCILGNMNWVQGEYGHVAELVAARMYSCDEDAIAALTAIGVRLAGGVFLRDALRQALHLPISAQGVKPTDDAVAVLTNGLRPFGLKVGEVVRGKTTLVRLSAEPPRFITHLHEDAAKALRVGTGENAVWARLYVTATRRDSVAQFGVGGFLRADAPPVYLFVLVSEAMFWLGRREDFVVLDEELRAKGAKQDGRRQYGHPGCSPHGAKPGSLRLWFPRADPEHTACFHPGMRIADSSFRLFGLREGLRQTVGSKP